MDHPPSPSQEPVPPAPPAPPVAPRPARWAWPAATAVAVFLALVAGVAAIGVLGSRDEPPSAWDPRVQEIVAFVEDERGLRFHHPVHVDFLPDEEFEQQVTSQGELTEDQQRELDRAGSLFRALGLVGGEVDLRQQQDQLSRESSLAFYRPDTERIVVRGTELTPSVRATVAHELVHALQDQHFDLDARREAAGEEGGMAYRAVVEGDASRVEEAYVEDLSRSDRQAHEEEQEAQAEGYDVEGVPEVLQSVMAAPYVMGPLLVALAEVERGNAGVDDLLRSTPRSEAGLFEPRRFADQPVEVSAPPVPDGAAVVDDGGPFGSLSWFAVLASRLDGWESLGAVDGWAGDASVTYERDGRMCVATRFAGRDSRATDRMAAALERWAGSLPPGVATVSHPEPGLVDLVSCDPGTSVDVAPTRSLNAAMAWPATRAGLALGLLQDIPAATEEAAWCTAERILDATTAEQLAGGGLRDVMARVARSSAQACGVPL